jgi:hypothetical protein
LTTISIIDSGTMATAIGTQAAKHGHTIELTSRNTALRALPAGRPPLPNHSPGAIVWATERELQ